MSATTGDGVSGVHADDRSRTGSDSQTFSVNGPGTWTVSDRYIADGVAVLSIHERRREQGVVNNFNAPDYLVDISVPGRSRTRTPT